MKKIFCFIAATLFFASCSPNYRNKIINRGLAQQCNYLPLTDSVRDLIAQGFVHADASHARNPLVCDSVYTVEMTTYQKWKSGDKWMLFSGIVFLLIAIGFFIRQTSVWDDKQSYVVGLMICIIIGGGLIGGFYCFSDSRDIRKADYIHYTQSDGDLHAFWAVPAQSY